MNDDLKEFIEFAKEHLTDPHWAARSKASREDIELLLKLLIVEEQDEKA